MTTFPTQIDLTAPVVVRLSIEIAAPLERVWQLHTDVNRWADWQTDIATAVTDAPLAPGVSFRWTTHHLDIVSTVYAVEPPQRILWGGPAHGITGIHQWTFEQAGGITTVRTEDSWAGEPVLTDIDGMRKALTASLEAWLDRLKATAEGLQPSPTTPTS
ncbi:hypothetical protein Kfla_1149 [Kribbella flavida DSM 17836]|uniref:Shy6-polyketide cyclase n=1 Tax=Kribbella flavida (strain DSM 17836 / JCM 10339 / NBRC 14399) TaxID=479435 RepID=D2Q2S2_KRIFD|nr:SRPBCC family protein [Kribbella flavida]ADB30253.1 hypothetical protein Kfla_1149 [Kribbella flavida DSM 17836]